MGLAEWFEGFCGNLQVRSSTIISDRYHRITRRLNIDFWDRDSKITHSLYVGSYGRNTAIEGFSDLDMVFELPTSVYHQYNNYSGNGQSALLQAVKRSIERTYPSTSLRGDGQVILVHFTNGVTFEVVPVFTAQDGTYIYPDSNNGGRWRSTNPRPEIDAIRTSNRECNSNLVRLCRMARAWRNYWGIPMGGLLVDTLAYQFIQNWQYRDKSFFYYDFMVRDFLEYLANQNPTQKYWRAPGSDQYIYRKGTFENKAKQSYRLAIEAINYQANDCTWSAKQKWREIFGTAFPN